MPQGTPPEKIEKTRQGIFYMAYNVAANILNLNGTVYSQKALNKALKNYVPNKRIITHKNE